MNKPKHIHVIGICGVATSALAIAFHKKGWKVTGSDKGFFPPVSTELEKQGVSFYAGWHPEKMAGENGDDKPDIIIVGTASGTKNPETAYAKEHGIPLLSFAEAIGKFFVKENSVVACGTWGKTSSSALLSYIFEQAGMDPSYMFGGISLSHDSSAKLTDSKWSVFEGDEYKSSPTDPTPKFAYYKPTHLLLTAVSWDHADLYPTEGAYFEAFAKLARGIPSEQNGLIVACADHEGVRRILGSTGVDDGSKRIVTYGRSESLKYRFENISQNAQGLKFEIVEQGAGQPGQTASGQTYVVESGLIGEFQAENIAGCFAMARELGIPADKAISAIASFRGLKRRLERRLHAGGSSKGVTIFDDIAHSPEKASATLDNLRKIFSGKIIAVFEPNIGGRERESAGKYDQAFKDADLLIIPRLTKLKVAEPIASGQSGEITAAEAPMDGGELTATISKTHPNAKYIDDDAALVSTLAETAKKGDVIAFLGSHGFRGMIEETVSKFA